MRTPFLLPLAFAVALAVAAPASAATLSSPAPGQIDLAGGDEHDKLFVYAANGALRTGSSSSAVQATATCPLAPDKTQTGADIFDCPLATTRLILRLGGPSQYDAASYTEMDNNAVVDVPAHVAVEVRGGPGADYIHLRAGRVRADGGPNHDQIFAPGSGRDTLIGGIGADSLNPGPGDDVVFAGERAADGKPRPESPIDYDVISCAEGNDTVYLGREDVPIDCEAVVRVAPVPGAAVVGDVALNGARRAGASARVDVRCAVQWTCRGKLELRAVGSRIGLATYTISSGTGTTVAVRLNRAGRDLLASRSRPRVRAIADPATGQASERTLTLTGRQR